MGPFNSRFFEREWPRFQARIVDQSDKAGMVPVDVSGLTAEQRHLVRQFLSDNDLGPRVFVAGE